MSIVSCRAVFVQHGSFRFEQCDTTVVGVFQLVLMVCSLGREARERTKQFQIVTHSLCFQDSNNSDDAIGLV
ncbi:hypothetical protein OUZ56_031588 [Daphnia magna]|uniref:Uncharacterized protein n=1 Tax=Daphnia magna TaxID=35525 RepID=A0ABQ9ZVH1_9CRUS|nr:hypothetical protein OUZ56_031588 [Daphnia magna]